MQVVMKGARVQAAIAPTMKVKVVATIVLAVKVKVAAPIVKAEEVATIVPAVKVKVAAPIVKAEEVATITLAIKVDVAEKNRRVKLPKLKMSVDPHGLPNGDL
jgi:hypothetical protein